MATLFSFVVNHDYGFAPNPFGGCKLAKCKHGSKKRNIVELRFRMYGSTSLIENHESQNAPIWGRQQGRSIVRDLNCP